MSGSAAPLEIAGVSKTLGGALVLHEVSFSVPAGSVTALLGPNGAGKTTCVSIATGLRAPDRGQVVVLESPVRDRRSRLAVSLVPQEIAFPVAVRCGHCLDLVAGQRPDRHLAPPAAELCARLGIEALLPRRTGGLSGGQQRRLALALGLVNAPPILIMDEATTGLDEQSRANAWQLVRDYTARGGAALVTSHILADIDSYADRAVALNAGRVVLDASLAEVRQVLGGSTVSVRLDPSRRAEVLSRVAASGLGTPASVSPSQPAITSWRSAAPLPLVALVASVDPDAGDVVVAPASLRDLLAELSGFPR